MISKFFLHNLPSFFKKTICILLIVLFVLTSLCGCQNEPTVSDRKKIPRVILSNAACSDFNNNVTPCGGSL